MDEEPRNMEIPVPIAQIKLEPNGSGSPFQARGTASVPQTSNEIKREMQSYMSVMKNTVGGMLYICYSLYRL